MYQLGDFGLARTQFEDSDNSLDTRVVSALGYVALECAESGRVSTKTDVYSCGVVSWQLPNPLLKEWNYVTLLDQRIADSHDMSLLLWMVPSSREMSLIIHGQ
ncbi:Serine-threonine/tyrosine-protein kinase, catalytic domain, partial [Dillenia turbinata]